MIGKNVGIRRAKGKFVLATNIDILFSDEIMKVMKKSLDINTLYRADRFDIPEFLPETKSMDEILNFCKSNYFRINGKSGTTNRNLQTKNIIFFFKDIGHKILLVNIRTLTTLFLTSIQTGFRFVINFSMMNVLNGFSKLYNLLKKVAKKTLKTLFPTIWPHTNACGDFTLLSFKKWNDLMGYPEWNIFSWHVDSVFLFQANQHNIQEKDLPKRNAIYHIDHEIGSGYSPEGAEKLFTRLESKGIPYLSNQDLYNLISNMKSSKSPVTYNNENWGFGNIELKETIIGPSKIDA